MPRSITPGALLHQADELAADRAGRAHPRDCDLRRAVSAAYYAVFHAVAVAAARQAVPRAPEREQLTYARYVGHAAVKAACRWIGGDHVPMHVRPCVERLRAITPVTSIAAAFVDLQEAREQADYDHMADFSRASTRTLVGSARQACRDVDRDPDGFSEFLGLVLLKTRA